MKGLIILANHFEDMEAIITIDILRRAHITIDLVSITSSLDLITQSLINIKADYLYQNIRLNDYDFVVFPGGKATFETNYQSKIVEETIDYFMNQNKLIACICAAPSLLGKKGYLKNLPYTCFPGCEKMIEGIYQQDKKVVVTGNIITSKAAGTTLLFSYEIIKYLKGKDLADQIFANIYYKEEKCHNL